MNSIKPISILMLLITTGFSSFAQESTDVIQLSDTLITARRDYLDAHNEWRLNMVDLMEAREKNTGVKEAQAKAQSSLEKVREAETAFERARTSFEHTASQKPLARDLGLYHASANTAARKFAERTSDAIAAYGNDGVYNQAVESARYYRGVVSIANGHLNTIGARLQTEASARAPQPAARATTAQAASSGRGARMGAIAGLINWIGSKLPGDRSSSAEMSPLTGGIGIQREMEEIERRERDPDGDGRAD